jgi:hypothetical protein
MRSVFIDESKSKGFLLCAVEVDANSVPALRKTINSLRLRGQSGIHFVSESPRRKRQILTTLSGFDLQITLISASGSRETELRRACLQAFIQTLQRGTSYQIWIDQDDSHLALDRSTLSASLALVGLSELVTFSHSKTRHQPLLLLPDAVAWSRTRGGEWAQRIQSMGVINAQSVAGS